ncbi:hypothetical protein BAAA27672_08380 [Bifidobacterium animalis subsp. animalis ATCC 27672]|nr:hypothetical protein BAAA27672_08380 [Bifidobacterium animalis subsp. animalis ATCC 27672]
MTDEYGIFADALRRLARRSTVSSGPVLCVVITCGVLFLVNRQSYIMHAIAGGYWDSLVTAANSAIVIVGPSVAFGASWDISALRQGCVFEYPHVRSSVRVLSRAVAPSLWAGLLGISLCWALLLPHGRSTFRASDAVVLCTGPVMVLGYACLGAALGLLLPVLFACPLSLIIAYIWIVFPSAMEPMWLRHLNGYEDGCCTPTTMLSLRGVSASLVFACGAVGVLSLILCGVVHRQRTRIGRTATVSSIAVAMCTVAVAGTLAAPFGNYPVQIRADSLVCAVRENLRVCVWPENADQIASVSVRAHELATELRSADYEVPRTVSESLLDEDAWLVNAERFSSLTESEQRLILASGLTAIDRTVDGCSLDEGADSRYRAAAGWLEAKLQVGAQLAPKLGSSGALSDNEYMNELQRMPVREQAQWVSRMLREAQSRCAVGG